MHDYDSTLKLLLQDPASRAISLITGTKVTGWLNVELPRLQNPRVDLLGEAEDGELLHLELQSTNDGTMALRMAEYHLGAYRLLGRFPRQVVIYVGSDPLRMPAELRGPALEFRYTLVDIRDVDGDALMASPDVSDNVIGVLARLPDRPAAVRRLLGSIANLAPEDRVHYLRALLTVAGLRGIEEYVEQEAHRMPILNDILDNKVLGREYKKGLDEGRVEGRAEGERASLRRVAERRFGPLPQWAIDRLAGASVDQLETWFDHVLDAQNLEDLLR